MTEPTTLPPSAPAAAGGRDELAAELCGLAARLAARGWCPGTGGNFSAVLTRDPLTLLITPSGSDKGSLEPAGLLVVDGEARPLEPGSASPSAEARLHATLAAATGAGAVAHTHSVAATLLGEHFAPRGGFTLSGYEMLKGLAGVESHRAEVWVPVVANSQDMPALAGELRRRLAERPGAHGLLLAGHGLYVWGDDVAEAGRHVETYEFLFDCVARRTSFRPFSG